MKKILAVIILLSFVKPAFADNMDRSLEMATDAIRLALAEKNVEGKLKIGINGADKGFRLKDEPETYEVSVNNLSVNDRTKLWKGILEFKNADNRLEKFNVSGTFDQVVNIPVLTTAMPRDSVIKDSDITIIEVPAGQVKVDTITTSDKLIGQALKRTITANAPIKEKDIQKAQILVRNSTVNIVYSTPTISLKTVGVAMESGGLGDIVKIKNASSGKIIQAIVHDEQNVTAIAPTMGQELKIRNKTAQVEDRNYGN